MIAINNLFSILTPIALAVFGFYFNGYMQRIRNEREDQKKTIYDINQGIKEIGQSLQELKINFAAKERDIDHIETKIDYLEARVIEIEKVQYKCNSCNSNR